MQPASLTTRPEPLAALRSATQPLHARLDSGLPLARPGASAADYIAHLRVMAPWLAALAPWLAVTGYGGGYATLAAQDLRDAGGPVAAPAQLAPPQAADDGFAWGVAYVVEGSQLGGQVLYRRLCGPLAPLPLRYLQGRGDATGAHWRRFLAALAAALPAAGAVEAACGGAVWAFETLLTRFQDEGLMP